MVMDQRQTGEPELSGSLCCTLLDRRSSVPLNGARITCIGRDQHVTGFDADRFGRFTTTLPQGVYDLVISARGYLSLIVRGVGVLAGHHQVVTRALVPGQGDDSESEPSTAVGGYITDRFGRAVNNVTVQISGDSADVAYTTRTGRDGAYLLHSVLPQVYNLTVRAMERRIANEPVAVVSANHFVRFDMRLVQL
jgi:hypothetical protein